MPPPHSSMPTPQISAGDFTGRWCPRNKFSLMRASRASSRQRLFCDPSKRLCWNVRSFQHSKVKVKGSEMGQSHRFAYLENTPGLISRPRTQCEAFSPCRDPYQKGLKCQSVGLTLFHFSLLNKGAVSNS